MHQPKTFDYQFDTPVEPVIYAQFIKYEKLTEICKGNFEGYTDSEVVVFIDVYSILFPLYSLNNINNIINITSCIINLAIHYRNYFKKFGIYAHIFLLYSPTMSSTNLKYLPEYNNIRINKALNNRYVNDVINKNLNLIGLVVPYLPDIYFKIGTVETAVMALDIIQKLEAKGFRKKPIFITSSQYAMQLPAILPDALICFKKRTKENEDLSYGINKDNVMPYILAETRKKSAPQGIEMKSTWVTPFYALCGIPQRSIGCLFNYKTTLRILNSIEQSYNTITPATVYEAVNRMYENKIAKVPLELIMMRYKAIDLVFQLAEYRTLPESKEFAFMRQVNDFDNLLKLNDQYFKDNPINLSML